MFLHKIICCERVLESPRRDDSNTRIRSIILWRLIITEIKKKTSSPKGNDRSPDNKQVFLNSSQVSKRFFQLVMGS